MKNFKSITIKLLIITLFVVTLLLIVTYIPIGLVAFVGMLPSMIIFVMEKTKGKPMFKTILPINLLASLWNYLDAYNKLGIGFINLSISLVDPTYIFLVILSTGIGLGFYFFIPSIYVLLVDFKVGLAIDSCKRKRNKLIKIWGEAIKGDTIKLAERENAQILHYALARGYLRHRSVVSNQFSDNTTSNPAPDSLSTIESNEKEEEQINEEAPQDFQAADDDLSELEKVPAKSSN